MQLPTKLQTPSATLQMPPSIRLTRSIPNLRTRNSDDSALNPISRDKDGFYRPAGSSAQAGSAYLTLPVETTHHLLHVDDTSERTRRPVLQTAVSIPNMRAHRDHDVFGKLLGWSEPPNPTLDTPKAGPSQLSPERKISVSRPQKLSPGCATQQASATVRHSFEEGLHTPLSESFPYELSPSLQDVSQSSIQHDLDMPSTSTSSPFGQGVRLPSQPRLKRKKSIRQLHGTMMVPPVEDRANNTFDSLDSFDTSLKVRSLREVGSSETIRTVKNPNMSSTDETPQQPLDSPRTPMAMQSQVDAWMSDTRIFDSLQINTVDSKAASSELKDSLKPTDEGNGRRDEVSFLSPLSGCACV